VSRVRWSPALSADFYDVALRDFGLFIGAVALARLAAVYGPTAATPTADEPSATTS
jgi:hypothetical protein